MNSDSYSLNSTALNGYIDRLTTITDNIANCSTPGYRRTYAGQKSFDKTLSNAMNSSQSASDFSQGAIKITGRSLDFAINGKAFFVVEKEGREYYTRNGSFNLSSEGKLITTGNLNVQGEGGAIRIPRDTPLTSITVDSDGTIWGGKFTGKSEETKLGKIRMVEFEDTNSLSKVGPTLFSARGSAGKASKDSTISNKTLESSNASVFEEMAELISCMRSYEACHKMFKSEDDVERKMIKEFS